jgi:hypothetical protein
MMAFMVGIIVAVVAVMMLWAAKVQKQVNERGGCPTCGIPVPMFRTPTSLRQSLWGGWTCVNCGTEMDREGQELRAGAKLR